MNKLQRHFPILEPPPGGLCRMRERLDRRPRNALDWRIAGAVTLTLALLLPTPWLFSLVQDRQDPSRQINEIRQLLTELHEPRLAINGSPLQRVDLASDQLEAYFLIEAEHY